MTKLNVVLITSFLLLANNSMATKAGMVSKSNQNKSDYVTVEGDIIIGRVADLQSPGAVFIPKQGGTRWEHGLIPFEMSEDLPLINKAAVLQAILHLQQHTNLEFVEIRPGNRDKYADYLRFIPANGTTCSSWVGKQGGEQVINLAPRCHTMNTVHEIGHAIGLWHEQSRADRAQYIKIMWENIEADERHNFEQHLTDGKDFGEYNYQSIMHYGPYAFSKNGEKTIIPLDESAQIGQRTQLSAGDIAAINAMYPEALR